MKMSTKIWLSLMIISNIAMFYFFTPMINAIKVSGDIVYFDLTTEAYIGIALFIIANVSGTVVITRFLKNQPLNSEIFFSTVPPTATFVLIILFFFTITTSEQTNLVSAVRVSLNIANESSKYLWIGIAVGIYIMYMSIICFILAKPLKRVEKVTEVLKYGKVKKQIKIGGGKQFQNIEYDLNAINQNYKDSDKIIKKIDPIIIEKAVDEAIPKPIPEPTIVVSTQQK